MAYLAIEYNDNPPAHYEVAIVAGYPWALLKSPFASYDDALSYCKSLCGYDKIYDAIKNRDVYTFPNPNPNCIKTINGENGMTGTVEWTSIGWLWHITSPIIKNIYFGGDENGIAATYIFDGLDQMAMIQMGGAGVMQVALDENYSGWNAEKWVNLSDCDIILQVAGQTVQLHYPKATTSPPASQQAAIGASKTGAVLGFVALLGLATFIILKAKK
jgi:hypothetical protein